MSTAAHLDFENVLSDLILRSPHFPFGFVGERVGLRVGERVGLRVGERVGLRVGLRVGAALLLSPGRGFAKFCTRPYGVFLAGAMSSWRLSLSTKYQGNFEPLSWTQRKVEVLEGLA